MTELTPFPKFRLPILIELYEGSFKVAEYRLEADASRPSTASVNRRHDEQTRRLIKIELQDLPSCNAGPIVGATSLSDRFRPHAFIFQLRIDNLLLSHVWLTSRGFELCPIIKPAPLIE